jgi:hypothetical protein
VHPCSFAILVPDLCFQAFMQVDVMWREKSVCERSAKTSVVAVVNVEADF